MWKPFGEGRLWMALMLCLAILSLPPSASAQETSPSQSPTAPSSLSSLYDTTLKAMKQGNDKVALSLIQEAISADPQELEYQYVLGVIYLRLGRSEEAEGIFLALLAADEARFAKAAFELALIEVRRQRYEEALTFLGMARPADAGRADFESGLVLLRMKEYRKAVLRFQQAALEKPSLVQEARLHEALARMQLKEYAEARKLLKSVLKGELTPDRAAEARRLLDAAEAGVRSAKPWQVTATLGIQYDSNLFQNPLDQIDTGGVPSGARGEEDAAFLASLAGRYNVFRKQPWTLGFGYNHYQLTYFEHSEVSLLGARPSLYALWEKTPYFMGLEYVYSHYWVESDSRVGTHALLPRFVAVHGDRWRTEVLGGTEWRFYEDDTPDDRLYTLGLTEMHLLKNGLAHARVGYLIKYDDQVPAPRADFVNHEAMVGFQWPVWKDRWFLDLSGRYIWRNFDFDPLISSRTNRRDEEQNFNAMIIGQLMPQLQLNVLFQQIWNDSNITDAQDIDPFNYERSVLTCMFTFVY